MKEFLQKALRLETLLWVLLVLGIEQVTKSKYVPFDIGFFHYNGYINQNFGTFLVCTTLICLTYLEVNKPKE